VPATVFSERQMTPQLIVVFAAIVVAALIPMLKMILEDKRADRADRERKGRPPQADLESG
jgi:hypothetical protein